MNGFLKALSLLTIYPCRPNWEDGRPAGEALVWYPVVGLLVAVPLLRHRTDTQLPQAQKQDSTGAAFVKPKTTRPRIERNENDPILRARLAQQVSDYFEATRLVLLEVKNNGSAPQEFNVAEIRESSQKLLEQSLLLKSELKEEQLAFLRGTVEQLEVVLFDLANLEKVPEQEEVEMLRAAIQQGDLLIKIEVIDLKALTQPAQDRIGAPASRRHATRPRI
ncbi:hypothetical protein HUU05_19330 [candidate division KSB1 bacterium]|nr:hypothetical protein [candidate division KSB1 bacterium]